MCFAHEAFHKAISHGRQLVGYDKVISHTFIRSLTPLLINHLNQAPHNESIDKQEVALCVATMEVLIQLAAAEQRKLTN